MTHNKQRLHITPHIITHKYTCNIECNKAITLAMDDNILTI